MESLRQKYPIKSRKIIKKTFSSILMLVFLSVFLAFIVNLQGGITESIEKHTGNTFFTSLIIIAFLLFFLWSLIYQWLYFKSYYYASDNQDILIRKGILAKSEITLPYNRITDLYVDQDLLDRLFGLHDLHFSTATASSSMKAHIDGLTKNDCDALKYIILSRMNENNS